MLLRCSQGSTAEILAWRLPLHNRIDFTAPATIPTRRRWTAPLGLSYDAAPRPVRSQMSAYPDYVRLGATVLVRGSDGEHETYVVVAPQEADPRAGRVSSHSPIGRALLGRRIGESVVILAPGGSFTVRIESVDSSSADPTGSEAP